MNSAKIVFILFIFLLIEFNSSNVNSQEIKLKVSVPGAANKKAQFGYYMGENQHLVQETMFDKNGKLVFNVKSKLLPGIYFIQIDKIGYFDLLIRNENDFSLSSDSSGLVKNMSVKGSEENKLFFKYQAQVSDLKSQLANIESDLKKANPESESAKTLEVRKKQIEDDLMVLVEKYKNENPDTYLCKILKVMEFTNPDEIDYSDPELLRTPFYHNMIRLFIKKNINSSSQIIIKETEAFLDRLKKTEANYQFALNYLINFYNNFYKNGINEVFVSIADAYFLPDKANWLDSTSLRQLKLRRDFLSQGLPGMPASDLTMESSNGEYYSLYQVDAKLIFLYFWSVNCGHCAKSTQILKENYPELKNYGVQIFAVCVDKEKEEWLKKIEENELPWINCYDPTQASNYRDKYYVYGSPLLFVISQDKKIRAVKNGENEIDQYVSQLIKDK